MIIGRYISKEITSTLLGITIILLLAFLSQQLVRYLNYVALGKIPTNVLLQLVSFEAPYILSFLLPLGLYLAILFVYGRMSADNEMAIMNMVGYGKRHIRRLTMIIACFVAAIVFCLMMWVNPFFSTKRQQLMSSGQATLHLVQTLIPGRFQASPDGHHVMYVEKISRDHQHAENVFLAQEKKSEVEGAEQNNWMLVFAKDGYQQKDAASGEQFFITEHGNRYEGIPGQNDYKIVQFDKYAVRLPEDTRTANEISETLSMSQLLKDYAIPKRAAEFQWRISLVIVTFLLALLAIPLSSLRPRQSRYLSLIPAILVYIIYIDLLYMAKHWVAQAVVPVTFGMWWVHIVMGLFVLLVMTFNFKRT